MVRERIDNGRINELRQDLTQRAQGLTAIGLEVPMRKPGACLIHINRAAFRPYDPERAKVFFVEYPRARTQTFPANAERNHRDTLHINGESFRNRFSFEIDGRAQKVLIEVPENYRFLRWQSEPVIDLHCTKAAVRLRYQ